MPTSLNAANASESLKGKTVGIVCDRHSNSNKEIDAIVRMLQWVWASPFFVNDPGMAARSRLEWFVNNIEKADLFIVCNNVDLMARRTSGGDMTAILNSVRESGKMIYEVPVSVFLFDEESHFGGMLIDIMIKKGGGDLTKRTKDTISFVLNDWAQNAGTRQALHDTLMPADGATLEGRLSGQAATASAKSAQYEQTNNLRIDYLVWLVGQYIAQGKFEELNRGISVRAEQWLSSSTSTAALQKALRDKFGDSIKVDYSFWWSQSDRTTAPTSHSLKVSWWQVEEWLQVLRKIRIEKIVNGIKNLINNVNPYIVNGYTIPEELHLDSAGQRQCVQAFAAEWLSVQYEEDNGRPGDSSPSFNRIRPHYIKFNSIPQIQEKLAGALASVLYTKISGSGDVTGPWKVYIDEINGSNNDLPLEVWYGAQKILWHGLEITQGQDFYSPRRKYLTITK